MADQEHLDILKQGAEVWNHWVKEHETIIKERKGKRVVLFPVRVDKDVLESPLSWATEIRHERNIGDFSHWKNPDEY